MAIAGGLIFALRAGHFGIAGYIAGPPGPDGPRHAAITGGLERAAVFAAVLGGVAAFALLVLAGKGGHLVGAGGQSSTGVAARRGRHLVEFRLGACGRLCHPCAARHAVTQQTLSDAPRGLTLTA
jgi:hypothetical protein